MKEKGVSFDTLKKKLVKEKYEDAEKIQKLEDIPKMKTFELIERMKKMGK